VRERFVHGSGANQGQAVAKTSCDEPTSTTRPSHPPTSWRSRRQEARRNDNRRSTPRAPQHHVMRLHEPGHCMREEQSVAL
jgi:hypothetical protein